MVDRGLFKLHASLAKLVLLDVNDKDFAIGEDVGPRSRRHVGNDDECFFRGCFKNGGDEIVGFRVLGSLGAGQKGEGIAPGRGLEAGKRSPGEEVACEGGGDTDASQVSQGSAEEGERALEKVGANEGAVGAEAWKMMVALRGRMPGGSNSRTRGARPRASERMVAGQ